MDNVKIISARRAYEFKADDIRLSALTIPAVIERIRLAFQFQAAQIGTPAATFGAVQPTTPPGLIFSLGSLTTQDGSVTFIRFLYIESRRIAVDVAGPSSAIDQVYVQLRTILADIRSPDGSPSVGEPTNILNHSTITASFLFDPTDLLLPQLRGVFEVALGLKPSERSWVIIPALSVSRQSAESEYQGTDLNSYDVFQFALRAGTEPNAHIYFSAAPLGTDAHIRYLKQIEASVLTGTG